MLLRVCFRYTVVAGHPIEERGSQTHTKQLCSGPLSIRLRERPELEALRDVKGCCVSKDGTLVITAAERAFVPVAYLQDEIIPKPKLTLCVPLLVLNLNMQGTWGEKTQIHAGRRGHTSPERILEKAVYWNDSVPLSCELVPYSAGRPRLHLSRKCTAQI